MAVDAEFLSLTLQCKEMAFATGCDDDACMHD